MNPALLPGPRAKDSRIILASASAVRLALLHHAGIAAEQSPAAIDEHGIKRAMHEEAADPEAVALRLAETKAFRVSRGAPTAFVIGADQMLVCEGVWFDKPVDRAGARTQLRALQGRTHRLISAACVLRGGERLWARIEHAKLSMRPFSDGFIEQYLDAAGAAATASVGAYQLEALGAQLFSAVEGDYFAILGLPLLPLLAFLRDHGLVPA